MQIKTAVGLRGIRLFLFLLFILAACSGGDTSPTTTPNLRVTWVEAGTIFIWSGDETPSMIETQDATRAFSSPDGLYIAYTTTDDRLHIITPTGETVLQTDAYPIIQQVGWGNDNTLYFNTAERTELGLTPRHDFYRAALESGDVEAIAPGGRFSFNPDRSRMIVINPGRYGEIDAGIYALNPARELLRFPAVASGTHTPFYPHIQWQAEDRFIVAIPEPDAIYSTNPAQPPAVTLWDINLTGEVRQTAAIPADYYGLPSQSGDTIVYLQRSGSGHDLYTATSDGSSASRYDTDVAAIPIQWIGEQFVYVKTDGYWLGQPGKAPQHWIGFAPSLLSTPGITGDAIVYTAINDTTLELRYATPDSNQSRLIATLKAPVAFQVVELRE